MEIIEWFENKKGEIQTEDHDDELKIATKNSKHAETRQCF